MDSYGCVDMITKPASVVIAQPFANFNTPDSNSCTNKSVQFNDMSTGSSLQYNWTFGDGSTSTAANPSHAYSSTGVYSVGLVITDRYGCTDSVSKPNYVNISFPKALFAASDTLSTCPPLLVNFTNASTNYERMNWDFGDGNTSTLTNPSHYYTIAGTYFAKLVVTGPGGCTDSLIQRIEIRGPRGCNFAKTAVSSHRIQLQSPNNTSTGISTLRTYLTSCLIGHAYCIENASDMRLAGRANCQYHTSKH